MYTLPHSARRRKNITKICSDLLVLVISPETSDLKAERQKWMLKI